MAMLTFDNYLKVIKTAKRIGDQCVVFFEINPQSKFPIALDSTLMPMTDKPKIRFFSNGTCAVTTTYKYHDKKFEWQIADHWCQEHYLKILYGKEDQNDSAQNKP